MNVNLKMAAVLLVLVALLGTGSAIQFYLVFEAGTVERLTGFDLNPFIGIQTLGLIPAFLFFVFLVLVLFEKLSRSLLLATYFFLGQFVFFTLYLLSWLDTTIGFDWTISYKSLVYLTIGSFVVLNGMSLLFDNIRSIQAWIRLTILFLLFETLGFGVALYFTNFKIGDRLFYSYFSMSMISIYYFYWAIVIWLYSKYFEYD